MMASTHTSSSQSQLDLPFAYSYEKEDAYDESTITESNEDRPLIYSNGGKLCFDLHVDHYEKPKTEPQTSNTQTKERSESFRRKDRHESNENNRNDEFFSDYVAVMNNIENSALQEELHDGLLSNHKKKSASILFPSSCNQHFEPSNCDPENYDENIDILSLFLQDDCINGNKQCMPLLGCEDASKTAIEAHQASRKRNIGVAISKHTDAAKKYRDIAASFQNIDYSLFNGFLLLSQNQAKSAISLLKSHRKTLNPGGNESHPPIQKRETLDKNKQSNQNIKEDELNDNGDVSKTSDKNSCDVMDVLIGETSSCTRKEEKIRAAVRGAFPQNGEADMTDSIFLGTTNRNGRFESSESLEKSFSAMSTSPSKMHRDEACTESGTESNPIDEMMKLERDLHEMDVALELEGSVASLNIGRTSRLRQSSTDDGSFCVVRPPSNESGSTQQFQTYSKSNTEANIRARASRIHPKVDFSGVVSSNSKSNIEAYHIHSSSSSGIKQSSTINNDDMSVDSCWWGQSSIHSTASSMSYNSNNVHQSGLVLNQASDQRCTNNFGFHGKNNTQQVMQLLDSLKTLSDENAMLIREVEQVKAAQIEVSAVREQMKKFKREYSERFHNLKVALDKIRQSEAKGQMDFSTLKKSDYMTSKSKAETKKIDLQEEQKRIAQKNKAELKRKDQIIAKMTSELKKGKEESKKKDAALRRYENFYREVKLKAMQRQKEQEKSQQMLNKTEC